MAGSAAVATAVMVSRGTQWNRIEHRLFCHIAQNWRATGLTVACELDTDTSEKGVKVTPAEMASLNLHRDTFHPEWNYAIEPRLPT